MRKLPVDKLKRNHPNFHSWNGMRKRCTKPSHIDYKNYGGAGITLDERWLDFSLFNKDMGIKPSKIHSIDRIDNSKGYCKSNCRWATPAEQTQNRRFARECLNGHPWTKESTMITNRGKSRRCKICLQSYQRKTK